MLQMTHGVKRAGWVVYLLAYGLPFVLVLINFGLTVLYLDHLQITNGSKGFIDFLVLSVFSK